MNNVMHLNFENKENLSSYLHLKYVGNAVLDVLSLLNLPLRPFSFTWNGEDDQKEFNTLDP